MGTKPRGSTRATSEEAELRELSAAAQESAYVGRLSGVQCTNVDLVVL
jgi:hypothetical protein